MVVERKLHRVDDHYEALGLQPDASPDEIKKAFKALALQYHPDQHPTPIAATIRWPSPILCPSGFSTYTSLPAWQA